MKTKIPGKMEKLVYKSGTLLAAAIFLLSLNISAQDEISKDFHKEYTANKNTRLELNNRYGDITVETSETNKVTINVKVTLRYPNRERAEKLMSYIDVQFSEGDNVVSAKTVIDEKFSFTGWGGESRRFRIDYDVNMPEWMDLTLINRYGNSELDDLTGYVDLDVKYGNLNASLLSRGNVKPISTISVAYGNCTIDEAGWLDLNVRYSGEFSVTKAQALLLDSKYSKIRIGSVSSLVSEQRYDNLRVENINNLILDGGYTDINIGTLTKKLKFDGGYGGFNVDSVPAGFESIEIDTRYTGVKIGIDGSASYDLQAKTSYCGIRYDETNFQNRRRIVGNTSTEISGIVGKESSPSSTVKVTASYGNVRLY
jgi:hypothetical protein